MGGAGNDTIDGGAILDRINYTDRNSISYATSTSGINLNLQTGIVLDGLGGTDTLTNIDFITGSSHADVLTGSSADIFEVFEGGAGDDVIDGGAITDTWTGTNANRAAYANAGALVQVDLSAGTASGAATGNDTLININHVLGSAFADPLFGSDRTDVTEQFSGRAGNDFIDGRGGLDVVRYDSGITNNGVTVNLATGLATDEAAIPTPSSTSKACAVRISTTPCSAATPQATDSSSSPARPAMTPSTAAPALTGRTTPPARPAWSSPSVAPPTAPPGRAGRHRHADQHRRRERLDLQRHAHRQRQRRLRIVRRPRGQRHHRRQGWY